MLFPVFMPIILCWQANPPQLHSNLKFIQLYRRQAKLVSEAAYYLTNLISAKSFIADLNAKSLSINEIEFEENMQAARGATKLAHDEPDTAVEEMAARRRQGNPGPSFTMSDKERIMKGKLSIEWYFMFHLKFF